MKIQYFIAFFLVVVQVAVPTYAQLLNDVTNRFNAIPNENSHFYISVRSDFPKSDIKGSNHFQGVQLIRYGTDDHFVVSASGKSAGYIFLFDRMHGQQIKLKMYNDPNKSDEEGYVSVVDTEFTHAGGIQLIANILVVPVEKGTSSKVYFYDMSEKGKAKRLSTVIDRTQGDLRAEAGAVGIAKEANGRYITVVGRNDSNILDFYRSTGTMLTNTTFQHLSTWRESELIGGDNEFGNYQNLNLIREEGTDTLYMIGMHNNSVAGLGRDWADLFKITIGSGSEPVGIEKVAKKHMKSRDLKLNFDAGTGVYVYDKHTIGIYAVSGNVSSNRLTFNEFFKDPGRTESFIHLYDDKNFQDRVYRMNGDAIKDISNYKNIIASGKRGFGDKVSSVRFKLPKGKVYTLYEHDRFGGDKYPLFGTGEVVELNELKGFNDDVSSSRMTK